MIRQIFNWSNPALSYKCGQSPIRKAIAVVGVLVFGLCFPPGSTADITRTQTIELDAGWNAVFLEVYPLNTEPAVVFTNLPVDIVASYYAAGSTAQFAANPGASMFKKAGWGVWYEDKRPDAFLKTLYAIYGQQPYLVHAKRACTLMVTGGVVLPVVNWAPNAYNLVGFSVQSPGSPTFAQFFVGSSAHQHNKIYRLTNGVWRRVLDPSAETMCSGEAFWIYCDGASSYQGPLRVETKIAQGLFLSSGKQTVTIRNETDHPLNARIEHVPVGINSMPLSIVIEALGNPSAPVQFVSAPEPNGAWTQALPPLEAGGSLAIPFEARQEEITAAVQGSLLKISTDLGTELWLPVIGIRTDLEKQ